MQVFLLTYAFYSAIVLQLAVNILATGFRASRTLSTRQNSNLTLPDAPLNQAPITWPLSPSYSLVFTTYTTSTPERNYYAALLSLQTKIFANYTTSHTYFIDKETIDYSAYGVTIEIGNFDGELQYELLSQLVGGVGAFLQSRKKCEAEWRLQYLDEDGGRRRLRVISVGSIKKGDGLGMGEV